MLWMLDEFETIHGAHYPGMITGKPVGMGGSLGRTEATGYGVIFTLREALKKLGIDITKTTASLQGFGNVAEYAARKYTELGGKIIAISCWDNKAKRAWTFRNLNGLDIEQMAQIKDSFGSIDRKRLKQSAARSWMEKLGSRKMWISFCHAPWKTKSHPRLLPT